MPPVPVPPAMDPGSITLSELSDLALGHLPPEESLKLLDRIEKDPEASADLDFVIDLLNFASEMPSLKQSDGNTR